MSKRCDFMLDEECVEILIMIPKQFKSEYIRKAIKHYRKYHPITYNTIIQLRR